MSMAEKPKRKKRFNGYKFGCKWIAENDEPAVFDEGAVEGMLTTVFLADLCNRDPKKVAKDIILFRKKEIESEVETDE